MSGDERCVTCGRVEATHAYSVEHEMGCQCAECAARCWGRARASAAGQAYDGTCYDACEGSPAIRPKPSPVPVAPAENCRACRYSYMEPDDDLTCGHPDSGAFGLYCHRAPPEHCGPERTKFEQHPLRNPDGTLKK